MPVFTYRASTLEGKIVEGTIEAADTIYGISMGTDSASRAISLELEAVQKQD